MFHHVVAGFAVLVQGQCTSAVVVDMPSFLRQCMAYCLKREEALKISCRCFMACFLNTDTVSFCCVFNAECFGIHAVHV